MALKYRGISYEIEDTEVELIPKTKFLFREGEETVNFKAGDIIFERGEMGTSMYSIVEGQVDIIIENQLIETLNSRNIFGEMAVIDQDTRSATVKARTDCKINIINQQKFLFFVEQNANFALDIMSVLSNRLRKMNDLLTYLTQKRN